MPIERQPFQQIGPLVAADGADRQPFHGTHLPLGSSARDLSDPRPDANRWSANTGFLWPHLPFCDRIRAAAAAGFDAVEFHDEAQRTDPAVLHAALRDAALPVLSLNVAMGATGGRAAMRGAEDDARRDVDAALALADGIGTRAVHVLAGRTGDPDLGQFVRVLRHAAGSTDRTILIEPLCSAAAPGYALPTLDLAIRVQDDVGAPNLRILFDYYHIETAHGGAADLFRRHRARIGHVQIASVPARTAPAAATHAFIDACRRAGWTAPFGCEYRPEGPDIRPPGRS